MAGSRWKKPLCIAFTAFLAASCCQYYLANRLDKKAIERRTGLTTRVDRYFRLPADRQKTVDDMIAKKGEPDSLKALYVEGVKNDGVTGEEAERFTKVLMCTAFAETFAQYLGNRIPAYAGDAWTIYRKNPGFRIYQLYPESIDRYSIRTLKRGGGPVFPQSSTERPPLSTGDIVTIPLGTSKYVYHSGVVVTDTKSTPPVQYLVESRGTIHLQEIKGGNVLFTTGGGSVLAEPVVEVIGDL